MSESHTSVSHDYRSDTATCENLHLSFEQSPVSDLKGVGTNSIQNNGMLCTPDILKVPINGIDVKVKREVVVEDSSIFLTSDEKSSLLDDAQENEAYSSDSGEPSDTEKLSIDNKPQIMDCPQFIHSINDAVNTNHVSHIQSEVDRSCQVPLTVTEGEITVSLANSDMWRQFDTYGTEMVLTKRGRRMFPYIEVNIKSGLELDKDYILLMDMKPYDDHRYKFHEGSWIPSVKADPPPVSMMYIHSDSPQKGSFWLSHTISFRKLKLTNCDQRKGHILLNTQHKYIPRLHIIQSSDTNNIISGLVSLKTFTFSRTSFVTVSTYKNFQITQLKVDNNPFAKHFRNSYHTTKRVMKIAEIEGIANASNSQYTPQPNTLDSLQKQYPYIKHCTSNNSITALHLENGAPPKTQALLHVDPSQSFTYTTSTPTPNNISQQAHIMHDQASILTMMPHHNTVLPQTQTGIYLTGSTRKSPIHEGSNAKKIKLESSSHQLHPSNSIISLAQPSQIPMQASQSLGIQNSTGNIQILTPGNNPTELQPVVSVNAQSHENQIITQNNLLLNSTKSHDINTLPSTSTLPIPIQSHALGTTAVLPPGIQIVQDRMPSNLISYSQPSSNPQPIISAHTNVTLNNNCTMEKSDNSNQTPTTYSLPNGGGSYVMAYLPILLPCGKPNNSSNTSNECGLPNIPILGSLPPGINFNSSILPTAIPSQSPCVTP